MMCISPVDVARPVDVIRSLAFYFAFYVGSALTGPFFAIAARINPRAAIPGSHFWAGWHRFCARWLLGIKVRIEGQLPSGPVIIAGKHESFFEAIDLPVLLQRPVPFAKAELLRVPFWGYIGRLYGVVPVERTAGAKALRAMRTAAATFAAEGRMLAIYPEGTRVAHGQCPALQSGFAGLYKLLDLPVVPMAVNSGPLYQRRWKRSGTITYRFGETIPPGLPRTEIEARVHAAINALNGADTA